MTVWNQGRWSRHSSGESMPEESSRKDIGILGGCEDAVCSRAAATSTGRKRGSESKSWYLTMPAGTWLGSQDPLGYNSQTVNSNWLKQEGNYWLSWMRRILNWLREWEEEFQKPKLCDRKHKPTKGLQNAFLLSSPFPLFPTSESRLCSSHITPLSFLSPLLLCLSISVSFHLYYNLILFHIREFLFTYQRNQLLATPDIKLLMT